MEQAGTVVAGVDRQGRFSRCVGRNYRTTGIIGMILSACTVKFNSLLQVFCHEVRRLEEEIALRSLHQITNLTLDSVSLFVSSVV